ncbi:hypothetical protein BT96DRAFT_922854 [Gymnopus androsaceus JB14]|uniref:Uncharacterized protein n=1 Tax=Gymnopus androsaceus JB14 TaxID=1447944 RepID=A0A6A4HCB0_9AGAR|nr:hypothetical protein BT96DRAFT_922854 [Gymnopus androsaceus JB14]
MGKHLQVQRGRFRMYHHSPRVSVHSTGLPWDTKAPHHPNHKERFDEPQDQGDLLQS